MEAAKLQALHDTLKKGAPRGKVGGLGAGAQRGGVAASCTGLPDSALYRHFVREGAELVDVMVGVPKHEGTRMTFDDDGEGEEGTARAAGAGVSVVDDQRGGQREQSETCHNQQPCR